MPLELWVHDAITGNEVARVFPSDSGASWSTNLGGTGQCSFSFQVNDPDTGMTGAQVASRFQPNARLLALRSGSTVVGAWKVEAWDYSDDSGAVTVTGVELVRNETKWRMTYGLSSYDASGTLAVANQSHRSAVRAIVNRFMVWSDQWKYPIDLPTDEAGGFTQTWEFWKKFTIEDLLVQIEQEGVEIFFRPYLTAGRQLRFETLVASKITVGSSAFHLQAEKSPLSGVHYRVDGASQITGGQGIGEGTGQDQPVRFAGGPPFTIPIRDAKMQFPDMAGDRLQAATNAWFAGEKNPVVQWTVDTFTVSDEFPIDHALTGRGWKLQSKGHPVFPDGVHSVRVIAASGSFGQQIKTEVQSGS